VKFPYIPQMTAVRPVVMLTGFLGAGKTTLLRELLKASQQVGLKSDVILNDYVDANLDSATLEEFSSTIEPLTATCACCEGLDFLLDLSLKSSKAKSDILFVELNGTADPVPIIESFTLLEDKLQLNPRWQICVIDVRYFGKREGYKDIEELQLQTASHIYFSHEDEQVNRQPHMETIQSVNPYASIVERDKLIQTVVELGQSQKKYKLADEQNDVDTSLSLIKKSDKHELTHQFTACKVLMPSHVKEAVIKEWLESLPEDVIRVKLLVGISERPDDRYLFEKVGGEISPYHQRVKLGKNVPNSAILIGPNLQVEELQEQAKLKLANS